MKNMKNTLDPQYKALLQKIVDTGDDKGDRTGIGTRTIFGTQMRINLSEGFPILTSRHHSFKIAFHETMMFLNGETDSIKWLESNNIKIWHGNTTREFLDDRGLYDLPVGDIGKCYGYQWRHFGGPGGVDQLRAAFETLKTNPNDRRMIVTAWNPNQIKDAPLPSCHIYYQFFVVNNRLSCQFYMRSLDVYHGCGYDIMCYGLIVNLFAKALNMEVGDLIMSTGDTHIYNNQFDVVKQQILQPHFDLPTIEIKSKLKTLDDICSLKWGDVNLIGYKSAGKLDKVDMAV